MNETEAETRLKALEAPKNAVANANIILKAAQQKGDPDEVTAAQAVYDAAVKAVADSGTTQRDIDIAAQAVLDERGETHSEVNILPPGVASDAPKTEG